MNTPQLENGYIKIANDIAKYLAKTYMSSYESQLLWAIFTKTYGYNKTEDWVSNSQFVDMTGMHKSHISRTIKKLVQRKIVTQTGNKIGFQKDSRLWCKLPKQATVTQMGQKVTQMGFLLPKQADTKDNIQKTITKDRVSGETTVNEFLKAFELVNPSYKLLFANKTERKSAASLIEKYGSTKMNNLLKALPEIIQRPYAPIITTPHELEVKMGKLLAFLKQDEAKNIKNSITSV